MANPYLFDEHGNFIAELPKACVQDCSAQGDCSEAVEIWRKHLGFVVPRELAIRYLREFGAWPMESNAHEIGLFDMPDEDLACKVLWIAACEIKETGEWLGLVH